MKFQAELERAIREFEARGGKIQKIPAAEPSPFVPKYKMMTNLTTGSRRPPCPHS